MNLFEDFRRTDKTPLRHAESSFAFLNRSSWRLCERDRQLYEQWFSQYPSEMQNDLQGRFTSDEDAHHASAAFELFLHAALLSIGCDVTVHPILKGTGKRPDFLAECNGARFYVEATVSRAYSSGQPPNQLEAQVFDWINTISSPDFRLDLETSGELTSLPKRDAVVQPILTLLRTYDPDEVPITFHDGSIAPQRPLTTIQHDGWTLTVELTAKSPQDRGRVDDSTIGTYPTETYYGIEAALVDKIVDKAKEKRGETLDAPLIVAINAYDGFFDVKRNALSVLLGIPVPPREIAEHVIDRTQWRMRDGVWIDLGGRLRREYVCSVWMFVGAATSNPSPAGIGSCLYLNPFADTSLPSALRRVPHALARGGILSWHAGESLEHLLGVPEIPFEQLRRPPLE